jgi:hypothetical protein
MHIEKKRELSRIILYVGLGLLVLSGYLKEKLPPKEEIIGEIYNEPVQRAASREDIKARAAKVEYIIRPLYGYELYGLVVSCHDSTAWWDYYHKIWADRINLKDICVIWGNNIKSGVYPRLKFKSGSWTCFVSVRPETGEKDWAKFDMNSISNNHLLAGEPVIIRTIKDVRRGDQIHLTGYLVSYSRSDGTFLRGTSTIREDQGSGACETIYVTGFTIMKRANSFWWFMFHLSKYLIILSLILIFVLRLKAPLG